MQLSLEGICEVFGNVDAISGIWKYCKGKKQPTSIGLVVLLPIKSGRLDYKNTLMLMPCFTWIFFVASYMSYHWNPGVELKLQIQSTCELELLQSLSSYSYDLCLSSTAFPSFQPFTTHHRLTHHPVAVQIVSRAAFYSNPLVWATEDSWRNGLIKHLEQWFYQ